METAGTITAKLWLQKFLVETEKAELLQTREDIRLSEEGFTGVGATIQLEYTDTYKTYIRLLRRVSTTKDESPLPLTPSHQGRENSPFPLMGESDQKHREATFTAKSAGEGIIEVFGFYKQTNPQPIPRTEVIVH